MGNKISNKVGNDELDVYFDIDEFIVFTQLVDKGGEGLPKAPGPGDVFNKDIVLKVNQEDICDYEKTNYSVMLIISGDAYFDILGNPLVITGVSINNDGFIRVGSKSSEYPIRVKDILEFYGIFTLQAVLVSSTDGYYTNCEELLKQGIGATSPYALFIVEE
ncbi:MAG: hypothetical protein QM613_05790 [Micrococcaceae bacterium]